MKASLHWLMSCALVAVSVARAGDRIAPVGTYAVDEADTVYAMAPAVELKAHSYRPQSKEVLPALLDVHGGAWSSGDRMAGRVYARGVASSGVFVFSIDFRQAPEFRHPAGNQDIAAAVRYLRVNADKLRIDPNSIGIVGSSSGGHLAMLAGITPSATEFSGTHIEHDGRFENPMISAEVRYVIALWPVADPAFRYDYAKRVGRAELVKSHDAYFGTREVMERTSVRNVLKSGRVHALPPLFIVQAGNDANIPREMTFDLLAAYQEAGGRTTYQFYPNQPHAFGHRPSADTDQLIVAMRDFISGAVRKSE